MCYVVLAVLHLHIHDLLCQYIVDVADSEHVYFLNTKLYLLDCIFLEIKVSDNHQRNESPTEYV
jgi:hypothetical protein